MDLAFLLRAERLLDRRPAAAIDHAVLVATLTAHQAATATARAAAAGAAVGSGQPAPLVELLVAGAGWREAGRAQHGSFNRALALAAARRRKGSSPANLPSHFSLPSTLCHYRAATEAWLPGGQGTF